MKKLTTALAAIIACLLFSSGVLVSQVVIERRQMDSSGFPIGAGFGTALPTVANDGRPPVDGELFVVRTAGSDPLLRVFNDSTSSWDTGPMLENTNTWTVTNSFNGSVNLGDNEDDLITVNAPVTSHVVREDFEGPNFQTYDITNGDFVPSVADAEFNMYAFQNMNIWTRIEIAFAGTNTPETFLSEGIDGATDGEGRVFLIDDATILDVVDNDAIEYNFGGDPTEAIIFYEDNSIALDSYCEVSVRMDDISNVSALDFYFGIFLAAAVNDTFAFTASNTWAAFVVNDTAGDLQICAEEDGDTHGCDDGGTTWADNATHVLRVEISPDAVAFLVNGTAVSATNAIMDADAGEEFVCRLGVRSAGTTKANIELNYVEIGKEQ